MVQIIIQDREELKIEELDKSTIEFYINFQRNFMDYVGNLLEIGREILKVYPHKSEVKKELEKILEDKNKQKFPNFNKYVGDLERACHAAQTLKDQYDLCIGIAKKGTWLSYVFGLHDFPVANYLVIREKDSRFIYPLNKLISKDVINKKILIFDNDLVTGETIGSVSKAFLERGAEYIDLLLIYQHTRQKPKFYKQIKTKFKNNPKIFGESKSGEIIIDTTCEIPESIRKFKTLEGDFQPEIKYLNDLITRLA